MKIDSTASLYYRVQNQPKPKAAAKEQNSNTKVKPIVADKNENFDIDEMRRQLSASNDQTNSAAEAAETRRKCQIIAMRIMRGDEVPSRDYVFLAKNELDLYMRAITMRVPNEKPQKHKRISTEAAIKDDAKTEQTSEQKTEREKD